MPLPPGNYGTSFPFGDHCAQSAFAVSLQVKEQHLLKSRLWETSPPWGSGAEQVGTSLPSPWQSHCWRPKPGWEVLPIIMLTPALNIEFSLFGKYYMFALLRSQYPMELSKA